jgi:hypothetical protein
MLCFKPLEFAFNKNEATNDGVDLHAPPAAPKGDGLTNSRLLHRTRQHRADAPLAWFVTAAHREDCILTNIVIIAISGFLLSEQSEMERK